MDMRVSMHVFRCIFYVKYGYVMVICVYVCRSLGEKEFKSLLLVSLLEVK